MSDVLPDVPGGAGLIRESTPVLVINPDGSSAPASSFLYSGSGTITANGQSVELVCPNTASALIDVSGDFNGELEVVGRAVEGATALGRRLVFKSGVGSLGRNIIENDGTSVNNEYRITTGGYSVVIRAISWTSGTANISISAGSAPAAIFNNGPVHTAYEEAVRAGRAFTASTGPQAVTSGNVIVVTFANPSNSGVNVFLKNRLFGNDRSAGQTALEYVAYSSPTFVPANTSNGINLRGATPFSDAEFKWEVRDITGLVMGGIQGTGEVIPRGINYTRPLEAMILPGRSAGYVISGEATNLSQNARISITLEWYEEPVN